ncbi:putative colanic acid biosynthesis glycosyltransferase [Prochlorococcus marinus str. MIT 9201]|uniref:Putative colanic acid biosynthesis glycosyltransferase n=1 Tax=Prochlorococcus marinus str. MIT 9201 TaxID=93057 RepID=A0A0A2A8C7_PROMR|nr:glycosyltransferase [Prochlorococcus marinus]KGF96678.1 putative colanic acid biosynthesis glycosyltransferase [Prochlorococcus marinus str. MIT 9201]
MKKNISKKVFFSFICVTFNNNRELFNTLKSLDKQNFKAFEVLIGNGGDPLNIDDLNSKFSLNIGKLLNKKDKGIYDAMNSLKPYVKGEYICYLNSGDTLNNKNVLRQVFESINKTNNLKYPLVWCSAKFISDISNVSYLVPDPKKIKIKFLKNWLFFMHFYICHQACFIRYDFLKNHNYDIENLEADYFLKKILIEHKLGSLYIPIISTNFFLDGVSSNINNKNLLFKHFKQLKKYKYSLKILVFVKLLSKFLIEVLLSNKRHYYKLIKYRLLEYFVLLVSKIYISNKYIVRITRLKLKKN